MKLQTICLALALSACTPTIIKTPEVAESSTFKALADGSQGTAWVVAPGYVMTAGHVCVNDNGDALKVVALQTNKGVRFGAHVMDVVMNDSGEMKLDACLLHTSRLLAPPLPLATMMPAVGDAVWYTGYPYNELIRGEGSYLGDTDGDASWNDYMMSAPCNHGASGSAVMSAGGVFGILVRIGVIEGEDGRIIGLTEPEAGCAVTPLSVIRHMLERNGVAVD